MCNKSFKNLSELRRHKKLIHIRRLTTNMKNVILLEHCDLYECGLCEYEAKMSEDLEIHLTTCEIYTCSKCDNNEKTLAKLKDHIETEHELTSYTLIYHQKLDRDDPDEVSESQYFSKDLC